MRSALMSCSLPRVIYEQMVRNVQVKYLDASWLKRKTYELAMEIGYHKAESEILEEARPLVLEGPRMPLAYLGVHKKLKDHLGLSRIRYTYTGGAAMGPDHFRFFHALGVNLKQIYGQTEIAGISVLHRDGDIKFDTVGKPIPETEIKITPEGEIISKKPVGLHGVLQNAGRDGQGPPGRLALLRGYRVHRRRRPPGRLRPDQGCHDLKRWDQIRPPVSRDPSQIQPIH